MASNKNQHYVPRCYLRPFSFESAGSAISLYNLDRERLIRRAPLKNQCSGDYFYGRDGNLERAIQALEVQYAEILRRIKSPSYALTEGFAAALKRFSLFQYLRTEEASKRAVEMTSAARTVVGDDVSVFKMEIKEAVQHAMHAFVSSMDALSDMKVRLLKNGTGVNFVTSDNPSVLTNRWYLQDGRVAGDSFGIGSAGAIVLLPLTPRLLCLIFDGDVYSVPHANGWVEVRRVADVVAFNQHQFINCSANVFVDDESNEQSIHSQYRSVVGARPEVRHRVHYAVRDKVVGDTVRYRVVQPSESTQQEDAIIHFQSINPRPPAWPSLLSWRRKGFVYTNGTGVGYVRRARAERLGGPPFRRELAR